VLDYKQSLFVELIRKTRGDPVTLGTDLSCATRASAEAALFVTALRCASCLTTSALCFKRQATKLNETLCRSQPRTASTRFFGRLLRSCTRL